MTNKNIADSVINLFFEVGIDGETMEYIIDKLGMRDQMIKQLTPQDDIVELEREELSMPKTMAIFTRQQLIDYTREIQKRAMKAAEAAIEGTGGDFEQYVELELNCNMGGNYIEINVDEHGILREVIDNIQDVFETDDESVLDEATNVITFMNKV